ncbi:hypothetical protein CPB85DRAFT_453382 [Mucidula mucida]|nr:hypothetical protein CPB85DRAFT_453382 [Mucidula mucida]
MTGFSLTSGARPNKSVHRLVPQLLPGDQTSAFRFQLLCSQKHRRTERVLLERRRLCAKKTFRHLPEVNAQAVGVDTMLQPGRIIDVEADALLFLNFPRLELVQNSENRIVHIDARRIQLLLWPLTTTNRLAGPHVSVPSLFERCIVANLLEKLCMLRCLSLLGELSAAAGAERHVHLK